MQDLYHPPYLLRGQPEVVKNPFAGVHLRILSLRARVHLHTNPSAVSVHEAQRRHHVV